MAARAIVYLGFRTNVEPPAFDMLVLEELSRRGVLSGYREYAEDSRLAIFDLTRTPTGHVIIPASQLDPDYDPAPAGCVAIRPAHRS